MKLIGIYKIQSKIKLGRIYIGSAMNVNKRWNDHLRILKDFKHHSYKLQRHFNKYGKDDLVFVIIELCLPEFLTIREQYYLDKLKPFFNVCKTAGSQLGMIRSDETRKKMAEAKKGKKRGPPSEEHKQKLREANKDRKNENWIGKKHTDESRKKMRESGIKAWELKRLEGKVNYTLSEETKEKMRKPKSEEHKQAMRNGWELRRLNKSA